MCPQKNSNGASLQDQGICPDCPLTKTGLKEVCRGLSDLSTMSNRCIHRTSYFAPLQVGACDLSAFPSSKFFEDKNVG